MDDWKVILGEMVFAGANDEEIAIEVRRLVTLHWAAGFTVDWAQLQLPLEQEND